MGTYRDVVNNAEQTDARQCSWCERYYNTNTMEYIPKPSSGILGGHGICTKCFKKMQVEINEIETKV